MRRTFRVSLFVSWATLSLMGAVLTTNLTAAAVRPLLSQRVWLRGDGLPSDDIAAICEDSTGYLWIATWSGLARFDGARFREFKLEANGRVAGPGVAAIAADADGSGIWAAPVDGGLWRYRDGRFAPFALPASHAASRVARLAVAPDHALWICFEGGEVMRLHEGKAEVFGAHDGLMPRRSTLVALDGQGRVWLANGARLQRYENGGLHEFSVADPGEILRIASARSDGPWVMGRGWLRKVQGDTLTAQVTLEPALNVYSVQAMVEDAQGAIWTGARSRGVRRHSVATGSSELVFEDPEDVGVLFEDRTGNMWAGSNGGGLARLRAGSARLFGKGQGLLDQHVLGVCQDLAGTIWVADRDGGVSFLNENGRLHTLSTPLIGDTLVVRSVSPAVPSGVWVATSHGLWRAERSSGLVPADVDAPLERGQLRVTFTSTRGDFWLVLDPGRLGRVRDGVWREFTEADGLGKGLVQIITEDTAGQVWIGTEDSRLYRETGERFEEVPLAAKGNLGGVQTLHFDHDGVGWVGTLSGGLLRLGDGQGRMLTEQHGLPTRNITQLVSDDRGNLWFGSPEGIFRVRRDDLEAWFAGRLKRVDAAFVGADDGLEEVPCATAHQPSAWKGRDGLLWFATRKGVLMIDPARESAQGSPLAARVDEVRADGVRSGGPSGDALIAPHTHAVEVDYSILCLATPDRVRAKVRLRGYDEAWLPATPSGVARYTRLPPGDYKFEISAHAAGLPGSGTRFSRRIVVQAAWWQTLWFQGAAAAVVGLLGVMVVRTWSHRRLRAQLADLERASALERERARIARNIHDDLGSGLTRISLLTQTAETTDARAQLGRIYQTVSELTQSMDEIVWAVNPKNDHLEGFANYLVEYAQAFLSDAGIRCRVALPEVLPSHPLPAQFRHHLFLSCKEALNNVAKHARATEVSLQLRAEAGGLVLVVADNGRGLEAAQAEISPRARPRNGLTNMRARLVALGGSCEIIATTAGTTVTFIAPFPPESLPP